MKTKMITLLFAIVASIGHVFASVEIDGLYYNLDDDNFTAELTSNPSRYSGDITIPSSIVYNEASYDVVSIGNRAFNLCGSLTSVSIPNSIINIEGYAFYECYALSSIEIPNSVISIGENAFRSCNNLVSVYISDLAAWCSISFDGAAANPLSYGHSLYLNGVLVTDIVVPENITNIGSYTFSGCNKLTSVTIYSDLVSIGTDAFLNCNVSLINYMGTIIEWCNKQWSPNLISNNYTLLFNNEPINQRVIIPEGANSIPDNVFVGSSVFEITIPNSVNHIGTNQDIPLWNIEGTTPASISEDAFAENVCLIVDVEEAYKTAWPEYASRIFSRQDAEKIVNLTALSNASALNNEIGEENLSKVIDLTISGTINSYDLMIMRNKMINLRYLDLTNAAIEANAYEYYTGYSSHADTLMDHSFKDLLSIKLPLSLHLAEKALIDCPDLKYAEVNGGVIGNNLFPYEGNGDMDVVLNEGVTEIKPYAFSIEGTRHTNLQENQPNTKLRSLVIRASIDTIAAKRFWYCRNLQNVSLHNDIKMIDDYAFCECPQLVEANMPKNLLHLGKCAFQGTGLLEVSIPNKVEVIDDGAFMGGINRSNTGSTGIGNIDFYDNQGGTYKYQFYEGEITGFHLETRMGYNYSRYSTSASILKLSFENGSQLSSIGQYAFAYCQIDSLEIPDGVTEIGKYAFLGNQNMDYLKFGQNSSIRTLSQGVFQNCGGLKEIILPPNLERIGELAFSLHAGDDSYTGSISLPDKLQTIGDGAFYGRQAMTAVAVPPSLRSVGQYAFDNCDNLERVYTYTIEPVDINQQTFSCWHNADLYVPTTSYYTYYYNTQWSQFLSLKEFDEEYTYFYINNDYELDNETGAIDGKPNADLNPGSGLIVSGDAIVQDAGTITIGSDENGIASILACSDNLTADTLVINLVLTKGKWSYFCFPFDILLEQISYAHQYVVREYNGATRAQYGSGGWVNLIGDMLQKGIGYIFQGAQTDTITFRVPNPQIECEQYVRQIQAYNSANNINANWNFIGNPYPSWYDLDGLFNLGYTSPIYIWNGLDYQVYTPGDDEYHMHPYEGFFTQNPSNTNMDVRWQSNGRETQKQADKKKNGHHMPARKAARRARQAADHRQLINLELASDDYTDRTRIVFNENASTDYELGRDAVLMNGGGAPLHIWSIAPDNSRLSINERPYGTGLVELGYYVKEDGFYTLSASRMDTAVIIYDNELQQEVDLSEGDYVFNTGAGTNTTRFSIIRAIGHDDGTTGLDEVNTDETVNVYTILGVKVLENVRRSDIHLGTGVYVVENKVGARTEMTIE